MSPPTSISAKSRPAAALWQAQKTRFLRSIGPGNGLVNRFAVIRAGRGLDDNPQVPPVQTVIRRDHFADARGCPAARHGRLVVIPHVEFAISCLVRRLDPAGSHLPGGLVVETDALRRPTQVKQVGPGRPEGVPGREEHVQRPCGPVCRAAAVDVPRFLRVHVLRDHPGELNTRRTADNDGIALLCRTARSDGQEDHQHRLYRSHALRSLSFSDVARAGAAACFILRRRKTRL